LPAQGLDHSAGYLLAAGICAALRRQSVEGGGWIVETSLRRMAAELLRLPRQKDTSHTTVGDVTAHLQTFAVDGDTVTTAAPAVAYLGGPTRFSAPRRWGSDPAEWTASPGGPATER
ncbi:carnitine dehydratase, partial [Microbacterium keratanolyticum]